MGEISEILKDFKNYLNSYYKNFLTVSKPNTATKTQRTEPQAISITVTKTGQCLRVAWLVRSYVEYVTAPKRSANKIVFDTG